LEAQFWVSKVTNHTLTQPPYPYALRLLEEGVFLFLVLLIIALLVYTAVVLAYVVLRERFKTGDLEKPRH